MKKMKLVSSLLAAVFLILTFSESGAVTEPKKNHIPYKPQWVTRLKKGKLLRYKRKEFSTPVIQGDWLYVGADSGSFYALSKKNGKKEWRFKAHSSISTAAVVFAHDGKNVAIFGDEEGLVYAVDASNGEKIWERNVGSEVMAAPVIVGSRVIVSTLEGKVLALDPTQGQVLWEKNRETRPLQMTLQGHSGPAVDPSGQKVYLGFSDGVLWALSPTDGKVIWEKNVANETPSKGLNDIDGTPLVVDDAVYVSTFDGGVLALSSKTGSVLWKNNVGSGVQLTSVGDRILVSGSEGNLVCLQKKTGEKLWSYEVGKGALTKPVVHQNIVAVGLSSGTMNFIDLQTGKPIIRRFARKGVFSDPVIDNDRIYYLSNGGRLYSLRFVD